MWEGLIFLSHAHGRRCGATSVLLYNTPLKEKKPNVCMCVQLLFLSPPLAFYPYYHTASTLRFPSSWLT